MKIKLGKIGNSKDALIKIGENSTYDAVTAYKIAKNIANVDLEIQRFETSRDNLIRKYGEKQDENMISVRQDKIPEFNKEFSELLELEIEVDITMINLEKMSGLTPFDMIAIEWMLELEEVSETEE